MVVRPPRRKYPEAERNTVQRVSRDGVPCEIGSAVIPGARCI